MKSLIRQIRRFYYPRVKRTSSFGLGDESGNKLRWDRIGVTLGLAGLVAAASYGGCSALEANIPKYGDNSSPIYVLRTDYQKTRGESSLESYKR